MALLPPLPPEFTTPGPAGPDQRRGRWLAIVTGAISVVIGLLYLILIVVLDSRGPMQPPPPEALGLPSPAPLQLSAAAAGAAVVVPGPAGAPPPG
jgi:hypothetical protein